MGDSDSKTPKSMKGGFKSISTVDVSNSDNNPNLIASPCVSTVPINIGANPGVGAAPVTIGALDERDVIASVKKGASGMLSLNIKISNTSASLIASGTTANENEETTKKKKKKEDGEVSSSNDDEDEEKTSVKNGDASSSSSDEDLDPSETGSISDSDNDSKKSKSKKKKKKSKHKKKKKHKKSGERSRSRSRSRTKGSRHSRHSRSRTRSRSRSRDRENRRNREDRCFDYFSQRYTERYADRNRHRDNDRRKEKEDLRVKIDKNKLRQIAIKQALLRAKSGDVSGVTAEQLAALKAGGKSVEELTDFCKKISEKDIAFSDSDDGGPQSDKEGDDNDKSIHHPFIVKDKSEIQLNIRNAKQIPTQTNQEKFSTQLRLQFPVSSGSQHRKTEDWVPVKTGESTTTALAVITQSTTVAKPTLAVTTTVSTTVATIAPIIPPVIPALPPPPPPPVFKEPKVFPELNTETAKLDITSIVSERLSAVRKLQDNPNDVEALTVMHRAQKKAKEWSESKNLPGLFVGSTGAQMLTQQELAGAKATQAWYKKDQFTRAAPVKGLGQHLLQKMGWKEGEGLGKHNEGDTQPLMLDFKIDRRGLSSQGENSKVKAPVIRGKTPRDLSNKHPVSALVELCNKRRWQSPQFEIVNECGPDHKKTFLFRVMINGQMYQPSSGSNNKKQAKAQTAACCLIELGLLPRDFVVS